MEIVLKSNGQSPSYGSMLLDYRSVNRTSYLLCLAIIFSDNQMFPVFKCPALGTLLKLRFKNIEEFPVINLILLHVK